MLRGVYGLVAGGEGLSRSLYAFYVAPRGLFGAACRPAEGRCPRAAEAVEKLNGGSRYQLVAAGCPVPPPQSLAGERLMHRGVGWRP